MKQHFADLYTLEGEKLSGRPWSEYPRPQLKRDSYFCLNGEWEFAAGDVPPEEYPLRIVVPFAPESLLSGLHRPFDGAKLHYRKRFTLPEGFVKEKVILHFGAVDQIAQVWLNGTCIGSHSGGYTHFSFDVTDCLRAENTLEVHVTDEIDRRLPWGKQSRKRGGMWYTPVSGIWQTVWMESVCADYIARLNIRTGADWAEISTGNVNHSGMVTLCDGGAYPLEKGCARIELKQPRMWSPEDPHLYYFHVDCGGDSVESYFALRTLEMCEVGGQMRLCLNGQPYFFHGLLDQGYFSDGLYTPASPEGYVRDIKAAKELGFNTLRKHVKIEPDLFYYECDRLGMIVIQDMVNCGRYNFLRDTALPTVGMKRLPDKILHRNRQTRQNFLRAMDETAAQLKNHPCICAWVIFNEGWGQFDVDAAYDRLKKQDGGRFIIGMSGWFRGGKTDIVSHHCYFKPFRFRRDKKPVLLGEFGGYSCKIPDHSFNTEKTYGYRFYRQAEDFRRALEKLYLDEVLPAARQGLSGAVCTQLCDVEDETNGMMTYDRKVVKADAEAMRAIAEKLKKAQA